MLVRYRDQEAMETWNGCWETTQKRRSDLVIRRSKKTRRDDATQIKFRKILLSITENTFWQLKLHIQIQALPQCGWLAKRRRKCKKICGARPDVFFFLFTSNSESADWGELNGCSSGGRHLKVLFSEMNMEVWVSGIANRQTRLPQEEAGYRAGWAGGTAGYPCSMPTTSEHQFFELGTSANLHRTI